MANGINGSGFWKWTSAGLLGIMLTGATSFGAMWFAVIKDSPNREEVANMIDIRCRTGIQSIKDAITELRVAVRDNSLELKNLSGDVREMGAKLKGTK